jgi:4-aminobutyrate aminotransferase-like enzyme
MGQYFTNAAWAMKDPWIGDVRFTGLLGGIELVANRDTKEVLGKKQIAAIKDALHADGMLITVSGLYGNVLRLQPPLSITSQQIDTFVTSLRKVLAAVRQSV